MTLNAKSATADITMAANEGPFAAGIWPRRLATWLAADSRRLKRFIEPPINLPFGKTTAWAISHDGSAVDFFYMRALTKLAKMINWYLLEPWLYWIERRHRVSQGEMTVEERVLSVIAEQMGVGVGELRRSTKIIDDLDADSLDMTEIAMELEDEFDIAIPDRALEDFRDVGNMINYVNKVLGRA